MTFVNTHNTPSIDGSIVPTCVFVLKSQLKMQPHLLITQSNEYK